MNKAIKVLLINLAAFFGFSVLLFLAGDSHQSNDFLIVLGLLFLAGGVLDILIAIILFITGPARYPVAKGFLLAAGVLFLAGFSVCSATTVNFH